MKTNVKRTLAIMFAFAIGMLLSVKLIAQDAQQIQQIESTIAQLQTELDQLRSQRPATNETTLQPTTTDPAIEPTSNLNLVAPGYDAPEIIRAPEVQLTAPSQGSQLDLPPASLAPTLVEQPVLRAPQAESLPTVIQTQPTYLTPPNVEVCPFTGRVYRQVQRPSYYRVQSVPRYNTYRQWDYLEEDRYDR